MSAAAVVLVGLASAALTGDRNREIVLAAWQAIAEHFYDPQYRGRDWDRVKADLIRKAAAARTSDDVEQVIYDLFRRLDNSHSGLSTPAERARRAAMLPLALDRTGDRLFVAYVHPSNRQSGIQYGDEILGIDQVQPPDIWLPVKRFDRSVKGNPLYGPSGSTAHVVARRHEGQKAFKLPRVRDKAPPWWPCRAGRR